MIYWYVDYLLGLRIYSLNDLQSAKEQTSASSKKKANLRQQQQDKAPRGAGAKPRNPPANLMLLEAMQLTMRGLFRLLAFCIRQGLLQVPSGVMQRLAQRLVLRFRTLENFR